MDSSKLKNERDDENTSIPKDGKQLSNYLIDYIYENKEFNTKFLIEEVYAIAIRKKDYKMLRTLMTLGLSEWNVLWSLYANINLYDTTITKIFIDANQQNFPAIMPFIFRNNDEEAYFYWMSLNIKNNCLHYIATKAYIIGMYKIHGSGTNTRIWEHLLTL